MKLLIWGISNVGKTTIGKKLAQKINYKFYDIDDEIIKMYGSIDLFQEEFPNDENRFDIKELIMLNIIENGEKNFIMAVSPIFSKIIVEELLMTNTESIEIIDTPEAIYDRLIIEGEDALEYKEKHKEHYMREIKWDQVASYNEFKNISKVDISNQNIKEAVQTVYDYLKKNSILK